MKSHYIPQRLVASLAVALFTMAGPARAVDSSAGSGEIAIYSEAAGGDAITTADLTHDFDTNAREDVGSFSRSGGAVTLNRNGHYLAIYNSQFDSTGGMNRSEIQSHLRLNGADLPVGWSQGYIRRANNQNETICAGFAVFEAAATDILTLHSFRTDSNPGATAARIANATGLQLVKLDEVHMGYARLSLAVSAAGPANDTFVPVPYDSTDELDAGFTHANPGELTLVEGGKYLVTANTYVNGPNDRTAIVQQLTLNGTPVTGSTTMAFIRGQGQNSCQDGAAALGMIITAAPNDILRVQAALDDPDASSFIGGRCGLSVVKLPDTAGIPAAAPDYIVRTDNTGQNMIPATETVLTLSTEVETSSSFSHTGGTSAVTVNTDGDYLFFGSAYDPNANSNAGNRGFYSQGWFVNGAPREVTGQTGRYIRGNANPQVDQYGNASGLVTTLAATNTVEMATVGLAITANPEPADSLALQGVRLASLFTFDLYGVDSDVSAVAVSEATSTTSVSYNLKLRTATTGTVEVTVTADGNTVVSTDDVNFFNSVVVTFTAAGGTTPQTVYVRAVDDALAEGTHTSILSHAITSTDDANYPVTKPIPNVEAVVTDDDVVPVDAIDDVSDPLNNADEDTVLTVVSDGGGGTTPSLLANDTDGFNNVVTAFDATSALGAAVNVNSDGTFTWDGTAAAGIQGLAAGEQAVDTFTYTAEDANGNSDTATVTITVDGVNDVPVVAGESHRALTGSTTDNLLANDSDGDTSDVLTVSSFDAAGNGGAVPTDTFNGQPVPLVFTTAQGATVTVSSDGSFLYDPSTSAAILALADGATLSETLSYDVFDGTATVSASITITSVGAVGATDDIAAVDANATVNFNALTNDSRYGGAPGTPTATGLELQFVADDNSAGINSDTQWFNTGNATVGSIPDPAGQPIDATLDLAPVNVPVGLTATYNFAGVEGIAHDGTDVVAYGLSDLLDTSIEIVFRPSDQVGNEVLWEVGGTTDGSSICLVGDLIVWTAGDNGNLAAQAVGQLPPGAVAGGEWVHVVCTIDLTTASDTAQIFVNGVLTGTGAGVNVNTGAVGDLADWCGTDAGGIGRRESDVGGDLGGLGNFGTTDLGVTTDYSGEVAILRTYESIFTPADALASFEAMAGGTVGAPAAGDVTELNGNLSPVAGSTVEILASGATVTFEADGSFTYDPNGAFDALGSGLTATDSFTYRINTHNNALATARVVVTGTNTEPQVTITASQSSFDEGASGFFNIAASAPVSGDVTVNLVASGVAQGSGVDYAETITSVVILNGAMFAPALQINAIADSLFEGGPENLILTIDSVVGPAVLGATLAAETAINDLDPAPVISIASNAPNSTEGGNAVFTISGSTVAAVDLTANLSYSGVTTEGSDFFGQASVTVPGGSPSAELTLFLFDDGVTEGIEALTVTIDSVSQGTIGTASDSTNVNDGAAECLFAADFEGINPGDTPGGTLLNADAPFAADLGTSVGSWSGVFTVASDAPGVITEGDDAKGDGVDFALRLDHPGPGDGNVFAEFSAPLDISGANTAIVSLDLGTRRTIGGSEAKSYRLIGLDAAGQKSFELYVSANDTAPNNERLHHVDAGGTLTPLGSAFDFDNTGGYNESRLTNLRLLLTSAGYTVGIDKFPIGGGFDTVTSALAYAGPATQIRRIKIELSGSSDNNTNSGIFLDDVKVAGNRANVGPALSLDGATLADGGSSALGFAIINSTKTLSSAGNTEVQVADPDAASLTLRLQAVNALGTITVSLQGGATIGAGANGSADLTVGGTVADVNATLAAGVDYAAGATGGPEIIRLTADDGGSSGFGGTLSSAHDLTFDVFEDPTVTIDQDPGQADPALSGPINFEVVFSEDVVGFGVEASDVDLSASTTAGALVAVVTGGPAVYNVAVVGMTGSGDVIATIPAGAAQRPVSLEDNVASVSTDNVVEYIQNVSPVASNLFQASHLAVINPGDMAQLDDIVVSDPNHVTTSTLSTGTVAFVDYPAVDTATNFTGPDPSNPAGFSVEMCVMPTAADVAVGGAGTENRRMLVNYGGSSNGSGTYLIEGIPYFISKMNATAAKTSSSLNDPDWDAPGGDEMVVIPLSATPLAANVPAKIALIFSLDSIEYSVNGAAPTTVALTNRSGNSNWAGDNSARIGTTGGPGGLSSTAGGLFHETQFVALAGSFTYARLFNVSDGTISIETVDRPETITATVSINGYVDDATSGTLSATSGNGESYNAGVWTITGLRDAVNTALADLNHTFGTAPPPATLTISIDDGDEDGNGALTGGVAISLLIVGGTVYVDDDFGGAPGTAIADADGGPPVSPATFLIDAFTNLTDAMGAIDDTSTVIVNDGDYSGDGIALTGTQTLRCTDTAGPVVIGSLAALATNTVDLQGNSLTLGNNAGNDIIDCPITGTGGLTKVGTDILILRNVNTYTGTTTVSDGTLRIGSDSVSLVGALAGNGPVVCDARLEFNPAVATDTITQTAAISGTGVVATMGDGTVVFDGAGPNAHSGGFELGDGATSSFDGVDQGAIQGFTVVNDSGHLGAGLVTSRGSQLRAGSPGVNIPNDIEIIGGGFRTGGTVPFELSGTISAVGGTRGIGNYGLEGMVLTISGAIDLDDGAARQVNIEGSNNRDNGSVIISGDIVGPLGNFFVQNSFDNGEVMIGGTNSYTGVTRFETGTTFFNGTHTGGGLYTVLTGATLAGTGTTASSVTVNGGGTLAPGASIGAISTGGLTLNGTLVVEVDNTTGTAGTDWDQVVVTGAVDLAGASIEVVDLKNTVEAIPAEIAIIANDLLDAVTGAPGAGVPENDYLGSGSASEVGTAGGTDANDVVLNASPVLTPIGTWRLGNFGSAANTGNGENESDLGDFDLLNNILEFAFGTDPNAPDNVPLTVDVGGGTFTPGTPDPNVSFSPLNVTYRFVRRVDHVAAGLTYTPQFTANGVDFIDSADIPAVVVPDDGSGYEVVEVPFVIFVPSPGGPVKASAALARVQVILE